MSTLREVEPPDKRLFAVGDIHGCPDELLLMLDFLKKEQGLSEDDTLVFIGDYIDRGHASKEVLDILLEFQVKYPSALFLRGNHEDMLLGFLGFEGSMGEAWVVNGGLHTMKSYGVDPALSREDILAQLPTSHLSFYLSLDSYILMGDYIFVHAGLDPLRELHAQLDKDLFWIRDEFICNMHRFEKTVVFGHTPYQDVMFHLPYKIGIDTGLVYGNMLSCVNLTDRKVYQVERSAKDVRVRDFPAAPVKLESASKTEN